MVTKVVTKTEHDEHLLHMLNESKDTFGKCGEKISTVIGLKKAKTDFDNTIAGGKSLKALETTSHAFFSAQQGVQKCKEQLTQGLNLENNQEEKSEVTSNLTFSGRFSGESKE